MPHAEIHDCVIILICRIVMLAYSQERKYSVKMTKTKETKEMTFKELGIDKRILKAITELGFETPMPVQQEVIPFLLNQTKDLVAMAHTGTGKTAAFGIPIIQQIDPTSIKTQALILAPLSLIHI